MCGANSGECQIASLVAVDGLLDKILLRTNAPFVLNVFLESGSII